MEGRGGGAFVGRVRELGRLELAPLAAYCRWRAVAARIGARPLVRDLAARRARAARLRLPQRITSRRLPGTGVGSGLDRTNDRHHVRLAVPLRHSLGVQGVADV